MISISDEDKLYLKLKYGITVDEENKYSLFNNIPSDMYGQIVVSYVSGIIPTSTFDEAVTYCISGLLWEVHENNRVD